MTKYSVSKSNLLCLQRLQKVRIRKYERNMLADRNAYNESEVKLIERNNHITEILDEHHDLKRLRSDTDYASSSINMDRINIKKYWLNYDLEMHQYYKNIESEELEQSRDNYNKSKKRWIKEKRKSQLIDTMSKMSAFANAEVDE